LDQPFFHDLMIFQTTTRPASRQDMYAIERLLAYPEHVHRHLDWRSPIDRLGEDHYWVLEQGMEVQAALACPEDPPGVVWVRFFTAHPGLVVNETWTALFGSMLQSFSIRPKMIVSVAVQTWFLRLLMEENFTLHQVIVVLLLNTRQKPIQQSLPHIQLRPIQPEDLEMVASVDHASFEPIWQNSQEDLRSAYYNAAYATVAVHQEKIVGYQISSATFLNAHLARLAVLPTLQGQGIGRLLASDMIQHFTQQGISEITVNTQSDNTASLRLYKKLGFSLTGEKFPVLKYEG
jgi:ribosomal protein S18 acetylase RimI-like enzyme